jgi:hypothetical protein
VLDFDDNIGDNWLAGYALQVLVNDFGVEPTLKPSDPGGASVAHIVAPRGPDDFLEQLLESQWRPV